MNESEQWFFVHDGEHSEGVSKVTLQGMIRDGQLGADVPVFREGMSDWMPASEMGLVPNVPSSDQLRSEIARDTVPKKTAIALIAVIVLTVLTSLAGLWRQSSQHKSNTSKLNADLSNLQTKLTQTQTDLKNYTGSTNQTHLLITNLRSNLAALQPQVSRTATGDPPVWRGEGGWSWISGASTATWEPLRTAPPCRSSDGARRVHSGGRHDSGSPVS